jgi:hypothetical protein
MPSTATRNSRNNPYQIEELFVKFHRTPGGIAWRWRTELAVLLVIFAVWWRLDTWTRMPWSVLILTATVGLVLAVPHSRRFITRRIWCVLTRHRLHKLCYEARLHTRSGRIPPIAWIRPTKVGERAWLICRAGICAEDFEAHMGELRAACYALDARVTRNRRWSQLVTIDIIRRDTLAAGNTVSSPLERLTAIYADRFTPPAQDGEPGPAVPLPWPQPATPTTAD